ncbi:MAG: N-acetylneuraminate synthase family protein, partial [Gammaproteobacteria bacterium]|nr:N-acetylneuraminate synthase family protein [Gammaproteobacteria bacterium]
KELDIPLIKLSSGDITNALLLYRAGQTGKPVLLSTGMSTLGDIEEALKMLVAGYKNEKDIDAMYGPLSLADIDLLREKVSLLQCTSDYPTAFSDVNLPVIKTLQDTFKLEVGFSDHTPGTLAPVAAVALGAQIVEKHFTLDKDLPGPDHKASLDPAELRELVKNIRSVEQMMGSPYKMPVASEIETRKVARRSLVATQDIACGETLTADNLSTKRPATGVSAIHYWRYLGRKVQRAYRKDELIEP